MLLRLFSNQRRSPTSSQCLFRFSIQIHCTILLLVFMVFFFFFLLLYFVNSVFFCFPCIILRSKRVYWRIASFQLFNANYIAFYLSAKFLLKQTEFILNFLMESFSVLELGSSDVRFSTANVCFRFPFSCIFLANDASY